MYGLSMLQACLVAYEAVDVGQHLRAFAGEVELVFGAEALAALFAELLRAAPRGEHPRLLAERARVLEAIHAEAHAPALLGDAARGLRVAQAALAHGRAFALRVVVLLVVLDAVLHERRAVVAFDAHHVGRAAVAAALDSSGAAGAAVAEAEAETTGAESTAGASAFALDAASGGVAGRQGRAGAVAARDQRAGRARRSIASGAGAREKLGSHRSVGLDRVMGARDA
jgi:hypothetical protein